MSGRFLDSNIVLYLLDDGLRRDVAADLLVKGGAISVQVLNEILANCRRKAGMSWDEAAEFLDGVREICDVISLTPDIHDIGRALGARYQLGVYDAMIVAAALAHGCSRLLGEDMQDGLAIDELPGALPGRAIPPPAAMPRAWTPLHRRAGPRFGLPRPLQRIEGDSRLRVFAHCSSEKIAWLFAGGW